MLKDVEFAENLEINFHRKNYPTSENENRKTKLQVKFPKRWIRKVFGIVLIQVFVNLICHTLYFK